MKYVKSNQNKVENKYVRYTLINSFFSLSVTFVFSLSSFNYFCVTSAIKQIVKRENVSAGIEPKWKSEVQRDSVEEQRSSLTSGNSGKN